MVTDAEAVEIIESRLNKMGMCLINKKAIEADIHAIRERKLKDDEAVNAIKGWEKWRKKID